MKFIRPWIDEDNIIMLDFFYKKIFQIFLKILFLNEKITFKG